MGYRDFLDKASDALKIGDFATARSIVNVDYKNIQTISAEVGASDIFNHLSFSVEGKYKKLDIKGNDMNYAKDHFSMFLRMDAVWKKFSVQCEYEVIPEYSLMFNNVWGSQLTNRSIKVSYRLNSITFTADWIFPLQKEGQTNYEYALSDVHPRSTCLVNMDSSNCIYLGIIWNFNFGKSFKKGYRTLNNSGSYDSGIVQ